MCTYCRTGTQRFVQLLRFSSLLEWWLTSLVHGTFYGVTRPLLPKWDVNTHNCRIWAAVNPHTIQGQPLHPDKVTLWCGVVPPLS
ncbi:hypothetical protein AVEN_242334-1 [Araneus ventricosus]|uniref:Uncharacterized protein n=1 Tax=Araneus ventricosus TaxID=182803 RepID=A0A4Y2KG87_ARAVE|nr:hypothetical protein AVEN_242334-1 [Araneus ventricosus]